ncbi:MAG: TIGR03936 family radical SAM-associated protein [Actinomycetes bacterium]
MARRPPDREVIPTVQKLRVRYAKRGRLRFASHRDFQRAFERALRRAGVPMAYSVGFSPHPKVSYAGAAATGSASEAEYLEIAVTARLDPAAVGKALDAALPAGLDVVEVVESAGGSLADRLEASDWLIELPGVSVEAATAAADRFLAADEVTVERLTKSGIRSFDARVAVVRLAVEESVASSPRPGCAILRVVVRHLTPAVRPDDVLSALHAVAGLTPPTPPRVTRLAQGLLTDAMVTDPLVPDRTSGPDAVGL